MFTDELQQIEEVKILCRTYQYSNPQLSRMPPSPHDKHTIVCVEHRLPDYYVEWLKAIEHNYHDGTGIQLELSVFKHLELGEIKAVEHLEIKEIGEEKETKEKENENEKEDEGDMPEA